eukprot:GFKZ01000827.1.p1 GENE.GFKZ01000827.1~~GFKZ01000827.1.p1  ORF type:complete len:315 (+),score=56.67 GFKZ01000827.1:97-1041(+)
MRALIQTALSTSSTSSHSTKYGDLSVFEISNIPLPVNPPPATQVCVRVHAAALNPVDVMRSSVPFDTSYPVVVGYDVAGVVEHVGSSVTNFRKGDRVFGDVLVATRSHRVTGTVAEYLNCEAHLLGRIPPNMGFVQASAVPLVCMTAIQALRQAGLKEGGRVFVSAGAGGVGLHLIQIAKGLFNAAAVATTASGKKKELVKGFGADEVVDYKTTNAGEELAGWADVVVDTTGEFEMARKICKKDGCAVSIVAGEEGVDWCVVTPTGGDMRLVADLLHEEKLIPVIDSEYLFEDAMKAMERQGSAAATGKIVIKM